MPIDIKAVAGELVEAYSTGALLAAPLSSREGFDLATAPLDGRLELEDHLRLVAAYGFHAGLVLGAPTAVTSASITALAHQLAEFTLKLFKNDTLVEEGGGRNVLRSPALCLGELAAAVRRSPWAEPLTAGELVSTGSLTTPMLIAPGEAWRAEPEGLDVAPLEMRL